jgi:hypothetical protein
MTTITNNSSQGIDAIMDLRKSRCSLAAHDTFTCEEAAKSGETILNSGQGDCTVNGEAEEGQPLPREVNLRLIFLDFTNCSDTSTAALAQLVAIRRRLLHLGRDLVITGLHGRARGVYEINRLQAVLPLL